MEAPFQEILTVMENAFRRMERQIPQPKEVPYKDSFVFRYKEKTIEQALIQKLARVISGLHAVNLLLDHGFLQEQAVLHRTLDELNEDIMFLAYALTNDGITDLHNRYLKAFYEEEFDKPYDPVASTQKRDMVPRKKIHAYLVRTTETGLDPSRGSALYRTLSKAFSGFVHAASPQIMDMWGGAPPKFSLNGMLGTPRVEEYKRDAWNYFYRGLISVTVVGKAFGDKPLVDSLLSCKEQFERAYGKDYSEEIGMPPPGAKK